MITLIVPTRNRASTLEKVLTSYFSQENIDELIFVIDAGTDDTQTLIHSVAAKFPGKNTVVIINEERKGASESRNIGVAASKNEYILFCDDDEYLEADYAKICLEKLSRQDAAAVSGRRVYMMPGETPQQAIDRFGNGLRAVKPFRPLLCEFSNGAKYLGDLELPITNAVILTKRSLLLKYPFDNFYARGNGYREETDFQMNLYINGLTIIVTNDCHSIHLPLAEVRSGGQRTSRVKRIYWSIYYTRYFYGKYFDRYAQRIGLRAPRWVATAAFCLFCFYRELLRPTLYQIWARTQT